MLGSHHDDVSGHEINIISEEETEPLLNGIANGHSSTGTDAYQDAYQDATKDKNQSFITRRQLLTLLSLGITTTLQNASFAILTPFFPLEASKKDTSQWQIGLIFGIYSFISFIISPLCGKILPHVGGKFMFLAGLWISAGCNMLFGALDLLPSGTMFISFCFLLRSVGAIGSAACGTASFALITNCFPNNVAQMLAWMETFSGIGVMIGPFIGGVFYQIGGYQLPFFVLGGVCLACVPINIFLLPSQRGVSREMGSMKQLLSIPTIWPVCAAVMMITAGLGFFDATVAIHVDKFDVNAVTVGLMFLLTGGIYACLSPFWGYLADKQKYSRLLMELGFILIAIAYLLIGPSPLLKIPSTLTNIWVGLVVLGIGLGCGLVPTFQDVMSSARKHGMPDTMATHSVTSGLFNSFFNLGSFIGPTFGALMVQQIGFEWSVTVFALACVTVTLLVLTMDMCEKRCGRPWSRCRCRKGRSVIFSVVDDSGESFLPENMGVQDEPALA